MIRMLYNFHFESGVSEKFIFDFDEQMMAVEVRWSGFFGLETGIYNPTSGRFIAKN